MRQMILAADVQQRGRALKKLLPLKKGLSRTVSRNEWASGHDSLVRSAAA